MKKSPSWRNRSRQTWGKWKWHGDDTRRPRTATPCMGIWPRSTTLSGNGSVNGAPGNLPAWHETPGRHHLHACRAVCRGHSLHFGPGQGRRQNPEQVVAGAAVHTAKYKPYILSRLPHSFSSARVASTNVLYDLPVASVEALSVGR